MGTLFRVLAIGDDRSPEPAGFSDTDTPSHIMVFDLIGDNIASTGPAVTNYFGQVNRAHRIAHATGWNVFDFDDVRYEVSTASGMGIRTEGAGQWTIRYKKLR